MSKRGLPASVQMRHDYHYVEELSKSNRPIGKIIPIGDIEPNPEQPRVEIGDLTELANSIKEQGVLEPLLVKPIGNSRWMIIAGERRWRASNLAGLEEVPCIELDIDDKGVAEIALIENLQRKDLTIWEEADGLKALADKFGYTQEQIAKKISKSRTTVTELMTVAGIPGSIREKCRKAGVSSKSTLLEIARQFDETEMAKLADRLLSEPLDRDDIRKAARAARTALEATNSVKEKGNAKRTTFRYSSADPKCVIEVKFSEPASMDRNSVLKALKSAFDAVKNEEMAARPAASTGD